jgi:hypothetical protein
MGNYKITSLAAPTEDTDGVNKKYVDTNDEDNKSHIERLQSSIVNLITFVNARLPKQNLDVNKTTVQKQNNIEVDQGNVYYYILDISASEDYNSGKPIPIGNSVNFTYGFPIENDCFKNFKRDQFFIQLTLCEEIRLPKDFDTNRTKEIGTNVSDDICARIKYFERYDDGIQIYISIFSKIGWPKMNGYLSINILDKAIKRIKENNIGNYFENKYREFSLDRLDVYGTSLPTEFIPRKPLPISEQSLVIEEEKIIPNKIEPTNKVHKRLETLYAFDKNTLDKIKN